MALGAGLCIGQSQDSRRKKGGMHRSREGARVRGRESQKTSFDLGRVCLSGHAPVAGEEKGPGKGRENAWSHLLDQSKVILGGALRCGFFWFKPRVVPAEGEN